MNAQALKDEGIDLERGSKAVDAILHGNAPAPAPVPQKTRKTRSDAGTKRTAKVEAQAISAAEQRAIALAYCVAFHKMQDARRAAFEAESELTRALDRFNKAFPDELQGK